MDETKAGREAGALLVLPSEFADLKAEADGLKRRLGEIALRKKELRKAAMAAAGWKRCCRCFPNMVSESGFCGCCEFNHVTGKRLATRDPDFDDAASDTPLAPLATPRSDK